MRQGCPISPTILALMPEPLFEHIQANPVITGLETRDGQVEMALLASDILCFLPDPATSLLALMEELELFQRVAGFKMNQHTYEAIRLARNKEESEKILSITYK
ncbi:hypothetical protein NDU88_002198 [Pleurodeles waltl]|uniref:Uncharacterized protein n=1 Tax=Pleurodeles waltl TaxID=8319 RepID=A0AAV7REY7_PLEWA|nr:hypothetical protein NDU88_002198 [Pleurodeles waltl]